MILKMLIAILIGFLIFKCINLKLGMTVLSYWIAENGFASPSSQDISRITNIVMQKWLKKH